jgi:hypothetical protein
MPQDFADVADGDAIEPHHLNDVYAELRRWRRLEGDGLVVVNHADGATTPPHLSWGGGAILYPAFVGASNIAARSGSTPGSGTVTLQEFDGTSFVAGAGVTAFNSWSQAVTAGKLCWVFWFSGAWWVLPWDC